jgi:hypothetical protein
MKTFITSIEIHNLGKEFVSTPNLTVNYMVVDGFKVFKDTVELVHANNGITIDLNKLDEEVKKDLADKLSIDPKRYE